MPSHKWGDDWFEKHGADLDNAIYSCIATWRKWGRICTHGKEKFGTFRDYIHLWRGSIWELVYPGHVWIQPSWQFFYYNIDQPIIAPFMRYSGLLWLGVWYQKQVYNCAIQKACKRYPTIVDELVSDLDGYMLVKPGFWGPVNGEEIKRKYWTRLV